MPIKRYKKKAILTAVQWTGNNPKELEEFTQDRFRVINWETFQAEVYDHLHESWIKLELNDHIGRGPDDECYPIKDATLRTTYKQIGNWFKWLRLKK